MHVSAQNWNSTDIHGFDWWIFTVFDGIARWVVPVFTMISGAIFLNRDIPLNKIYTKYLFRIATAFIFWSTLYALVSLPKNGIKETIAQLLLGHYHMWYLYMISGLYIIIPFLKRISNNVQLERYFLLLGLIFVFIIPQLISSIRLFRPAISNVLSNIYNNANLHFLKGYSFYYILGSYLFKSHSKLKKRAKMIFGFGIVGFIVTATGNIFASLYTGEHEGLFFSDFSVNVLAASVMVMYAFQANFNVIKSSKISNLVIELSNLSFGAFLVHALIIEILSPYINSLSFNSILSVPVLTILVAILSYFVSYVLHKVPILSKYIV